MQRSILEGFYDELEKIGTSYRMAGHLQARRGTRPIRAHNLLSKGSPNLTEPDQLSPDPELDQPPPPQFAQDGGEGDQDIDKEAQLQERALHGFAEARPYVSSAASAAVPAALLGGIYGGKRTAKILGTIGAAGGIANQALRDWASKHKRKAVAKKLLDSQE